MRRAGLKRSTALLCLLALFNAGCSASTSEPVANLSGSTPTDDGDLGVSNSNACFLSARKIDLSLAGTAALVISKDVFSAADFPDGVAFLNEDDLATNVWTLNADGEFSAGATYSEGDCPGAVSELEVERVDTSPTGEVYLLFADSVEIDGAHCRFVVVDASDTASCADTDSDFDFYQVEFTIAGDAYFSNRTGLIKKRSRESGEVVTLFTADSLDYDLDGFKPLQDGTLLLQGDMAGTARGFYRFIPSSVSSATDVLQAPCLDNVDVNFKGSAPRDELFVAADGMVYLKSTGSVCDGVDVAQTYRADVTEDGLEFTAVPGISADSFAEDSAGGVYAVIGSDDDDQDAAVLVSAEPGVTFTTSLVTTESFAVIGDAIYAAGTNAAGKSSLIRKSLLTGVETDILGELDLVVQVYDVNGSGDVTLAALDEAQARRVFLRYRSLDDSLEELTSLPGDVLEIVYVGEDDEDAAVTGL